MYCEPFHDRKAKSTLNHIRSQVKLSVNAQEDNGSNFTLSQISPYIKILRKIRMNINPISLVEMVKHSRKQLSTG